MSPRVADPTLPDRIVDAAAHLLATGGERALTVRRLAAEVGSSTMAVYTHFGSLDEVTRHVMRRGFAEFGAELTRGAVTDDPVADWMAQGWGYRRFARTRPDLYAVMFSDRLTPFRQGDPADLEAAMVTFVALLERLDACVEAGRFDLADTYLTGEVVWAISHGLALIELTGYPATADRDPRDMLVEAQVRLAVGFGDDPAMARASAATARRRGERTDRSDGLPPVGPVNGV